jgi:probable phosphoglycerate mutase
VTRQKKKSAYPYCEDVDFFRNRVFGALDGAIAESHGMRIVVACHGGVINAVLSRVLGSSFDHLVPVHHTSISVMRAADTRRVILTVNDYSHVMAFQHSRGDVNA